MPSLPERIRSGAKAAGGIIGYSLDLLRQEVALIAIHFHWSYEDTMNMEHQERREWVQEIKRLVSKEKSFE
ncbi:MAG TPA: DUF6760 family protein [candidate division Zixibacteria bacterium]|nr:DUF6760 family protein [candidate division Zixibacteria bacterium]